MEGPLGPHRFTCALMDTLDARSVRLLEAAKSAGSAPSQDTITANTRAIEVQSP